jgi:tRNA(fMet)-specific endonuclease VapC
VTLKFLLDTTIISAPVAKIPNQRVVRKLAQQSVHCAIAAPVWNELIYGCSRLPEGKRKSALYEYIHDVVRRSFPILPYDEVAAEWHGAQRARLEALGKTPPFVDGQVAAIARCKRLTLVTANTEDFRCFDDLEIVDWSK